MKRILLIILTLCLCAAALASCAKRDRDSVPNAPTDGILWPQVPTIFPLEPPHLLVSDGRNAIEAQRLTTSWLTENEDGMGSGIESDSPHPLDCKDRLPVLEITKKSTMILNFSAAPSKVTVRRYKLSATDYDDYDEITASLDSFEAKAGDYVYEIIASWSGENYSGTVYYAFRTEK